MHALNAIPRPHHLVGSIRRFGPTGPVYEVQAVVDRRDDDQAMLVVVVPSTGETLEVPYLQAVVDPTEDD